MTPIAIPDAWQGLLRTTGEDPDALVRPLQELLGERATIPPPHLLTRALHLGPLEGITVLILGQDPYPTPGHACGLAFSVPATCARLPGSLRNIMDEVEANVGRRPGQDLEPWARQGVLLLNRWLSLDERPAVRVAWDALTGALMRALVQRHPSPLVVMGWGNPAMQHIEDATGILAPGSCAAPRLYLRASHPSPLGFYKASKKAPAFRNCRHFHLANAWLSAQGAREIAWA